MTLEQFQSLKEGDVVRVIPFEKAVNKPENKDKKRILGLLECFYKEQEFIVDLKNINKEENFIYSHYFYPYWALDLVENKEQKIKIEIKEENVKMDNAMLKVVEQDQKHEIYKAGRFYVALVRNEKGMVGVGISRRANSDKPNPKLGVDKAIGRATQALTWKEKGKEITSEFVFLG